MKPYSSIETVYKRDKNTNRLDFGNIRMPEVALVNTWRYREKIDGTNIRVIVTHGNSVDDNGYTMRVAGRTDKAQLPSGMMDVIKSIFTPDILEKIKDIYLANEDSVITFYGEGYGPGITGSEKMNYRPFGKAFRCFDIMLGEKYFIPDIELDDRCGELNIPVAPFLGAHNWMPETIEDLADIINDSEVAYRDYKQASPLTDREYQRAEGVVAKPAYTLYNANGERVMFKLTYREWDK